MGYVSGEDGFTLIFKYDTETNRFFFLFFDEVIGSGGKQENGKISTITVQRLEQRWSNMRLKT